MKTRSNARWILYEICLVRVLKRCDFLDSASERTNGASIRPHLSHPKTGAGWAWRGLAGKRLRLTCFEQPQPFQSQKHGSSPEAQRGHDEQAAPRDVALAYVRFAIANPGLFTLMFRGDAIDRKDADFHAASARAFARLSGMAQVGEQKDRAATMVSLWGKVHGVAVLAVDGLLTGIAGANSPEAFDGLIERVFREFFLNAKYSVAVFRT